MLTRKFLTGKIHRATVTSADVSYVGSITIDRDLMEAVDFRPLEEVEIWDVTNGARFSTYCLPGERGSGIIQINGAAAHLAHKGDKIIVASYGIFDSESLGKHVVPVVIPDDNNMILRRLEYRADLANGDFEVVDL
jgi:aspartate 1-decarboxylase